MAGLVPLEAARIFYSGIADARFRNPEGVALAPDGSLWSGTSTGWVYRIARDGSGADAIASTGGFLLGIAFSGGGDLFVCDLLQATVLRLPRGSDSFVPFARETEGRMLVPNVVVVDDVRGVVYVSDSHEAHVPGPGVWRFDLETGEGSLWYAGDLDFANGLVLERGGDALLVAESWGRRVSRIEIAADGSAMTAEAYVSVPDDVVVDGLALDRDGKLLLMCYAPSRIYRRRTDGDLEVIVEDPDHDVLCHPTNGVVVDQVLYTANLGRWHITAVPLP